METLIRVGGQRYDLGPQNVVDGLFATITYRLEPDGRGTRFPVVMNRLYGGGLSPADAREASLELEQIEKGLNALSPEAVVWSLDDLRRRDDSRLPVNHASKTARGYFVAPDGRPMLAAIQEAVQRSNEQRQALLLASSEARENLRPLVGALVGGLIWVVAWRLIAPTSTLSTGSGSAETRLLAWPLGLFFVGAGAAGLAVSRWPSADFWFRSRPWAGWGIGLLWFGLCAWLAAHLAANLPG